MALVLVVLAMGCKMMSLPRAPAKRNNHDVDFHEALAFAKRANAAYLRPSAIRARYSNKRVVVEQLPASEVQFFIVFDDQAQTQHIAVRGTSNLTNIRVDSEINPDPDPKLRVCLHRGFASAGKELYERIRPHLKQGYGTTVTGHSLGGALATILGMHLSRDRLRLQRIITFGQPKVTNLDGARRYQNLPILRFVNHTDPVVDLPPLLSLRDRRWRYTHFGPEVILWTEKRFIYVEEHQVLSSAVLSFWANLGQHDLAEHKIRAYLGNLNLKLNRAEEIRFEDRQRYSD
ncbi:MAG: lipase family protein [Planctomycetota bacterium]